MIRKFNFTGRRRLKRECISVSLLGTDGSSMPRIDANFDLSGLQCPVTARVYVEAYRASAYKRFDCGTVAATAMPVDTSVEDVASGADLRFRVKIVDESNSIGRLLAVADNIRPVTPEQ